MAGSVKVYILTAWEYGNGNTAPISVFDTLEKAELYIDSHPLIPEDAMYDIWTRDVK